MSDSKTTISYFLQSRPAGTDDPWEQTGLRWSWQDPSKAAEKLATAREMRPEREHRLVTRTTTVTETPTNTPPDPTTGISVQHADALWDAIAIPGPRTPTFTEQHERVCRAVANIVSEVTAGQADRAAILREAADVLDTLPPDATSFDEAEHKYKGGAAAERLRRMADEAQQDEGTTADKAAALGLTDAEYRAHSHAAAVAAVRAAIPGMYAHVGFRLEDALNEAAEAQQPEPQAAGEPLVHVGWWCWRGNDHGHLATTACRSDNVPLHVPAEWADDMRAVLQRIENGDDEEA